MGNQGCIWYYPGGQRYFPPQPIQSVDATGASDVFIATLAVMLIEGHEMEIAVDIANYAAAFSVMWEGAQNITPEHGLLEQRLEMTTGGTQD